jgi:release factor glutamine methyltransferase
MTQTSTDRSVHSLLRQGVEQLHAASVPSFTFAAELLLLHVAGRDRTWLYAHAEEILPPETVDRYFSLVRRRAVGEPTQHLTGKQEFWGLEFEVTPDVLIPRPETEHLIEVALDRLAVRELRAGRPAQFAGAGLTIVDVGTGSGCIAISLAEELPVAGVYATDISKAALDVAQRNAARLGFADRIRFIESDLFAAFQPNAASVSSRALGDTNEPLPFDLIISNPPYVGLHEAGSLAIEVRDHEPRVALYGGQEGYELYGALVSQAAQFLKPGGLLVLELGHNSLPAVQPLLDTPEWCAVGVANDLAAIPRVLSAQRS